MRIQKFEIGIRGEASVKDQSEISKLNPKLETLNSKQTQNPKFKIQNKDFSVFCLEF